MASYNPGMRPTPASPASAAGSPASLSPISALSPLDGRYAGRLGSLRPLMSELGYMHRRVQVEIAWFIALSDAGFNEFKPLSPGARTYLLGLVKNFSEEDGEAIKAIEKTTNHDVKAVEYWIKSKFEARPELERAADTTGLPWKGLGDAIDAFVVCRDIGWKCVPDLAPELKIEIPSGPFPTAPGQPITSIDLDAVRQRVEGVDAAGVVPGREQLAVVQVERGVGGVLAILAVRRGIFVSSDARAYRMVLLYRGHAPTRNSPLNLQSSQVPRQVYRVALSM